MQQPPPTSTFYRVNFRRQGVQKVETGYFTAVSEDKVRFALYARGLEVMSVFPIVAEHIYGPNVNLPPRSRCHYCGSESGQMTRDHIVPKSKGGVTRPINIVPACMPCNNRKADRWPTCGCEICLAAVAWHEANQRPEDEMEMTG